MAVGIVQADKLPFFFYLDTSCARLRKGINHRIYAATKTEEQRLVAIRTVSRVQHKNWNELQH